MDRIYMHNMRKGFKRIVARYGFMEKADVPQVLKRAKALGTEVDLKDTTYYLGRERLFPTGKARLARWRKKLYIVMSQNSRSATEYFAIPPNRVVELGAQIEM